jgi:hypothetical protein
MFKFAVASSVAGAQGATFGPYPGYSGDLNVAGSVSAHYYGDHVYVNYRINGVESDACQTAPEGVANACGIHIHAGTTCDDASAVGGHYFDSDSIESDPWSPVTYTAKADGSASGSQSVTIGRGQAIGGRAMVVHDSTGARVACALLPAGLFKPESSVQLGPYPGYAGDLKVTGSVEAHYFLDKVYLTFGIHGVESDACKTAPEGVANACGIHIHAGTTCDDASAVGGHYFDSDSIESDPWSPVTYSALMDGSAIGVKSVTIGRGQDIGGRAMVVHDSTGARVACALLPARMFVV